MDAVQEVYIRSMGKIFIGEVLGPLNSTLFSNKYDYFGVKIKYGNKYIKVKLDNKFSRMIYQKGDKVKIVCIPKKTGNAVAYLPGKYGGVLLSIFVFIFGSTINYLLFRFA